MSAIGAPGNFSPRDTAIWLKLAKTNFQNLWNLIKGLTTNWEAFSKNSQKLGKSGRLWHSRQGLRPGPHSSASWKNCFSKNVSWMAVPISLKSLECESYSQLFQQLVNISRSYFAQLCAPGGTSPVDGSSRVALLTPPPTPAPQGGSDGQLGKHAALLSHTAQHRGRPTQWSWY